MKLLKFYAEWCGPCKTFGPIVEKVCEEKNISLSSIDVDLDSEMAQAHNVRSIPHIVLFGDDGRQIKSKSGAMSQSELEKFLDV